MEYEIQNLASYLIVSKNVFRSLISSGIRLRIRFSDADFLFSSWNASSVRFNRYSITFQPNEYEKKMVYSLNSSYGCRIVEFLNLQSVSEAPPCSLNILSFRFTFKSPFLRMPITISYDSPGCDCSALVNAARSVCDAATSRRSSCKSIMVIVFSFIYISN